MSLVLKINTEPSAEPLSATDIYDQSRIDGTDEAVLLAAYIAAARQHVENVTGRALLTQTWDMYLDDWPANGVIKLPKPPLVSVTHIKYTDSDDTESTFSADYYSVDTNSVPGRIVLDYGESWPTDTLATNNPITIRFVAGYGADSTSVPDPILHAMKLLVGSWFENRESLLVGPAGLEIMEVPMGFRALLANYTDYTVWS